MKALLVERSVPRFLSARVAGSVGLPPGPATTPLRLVDCDPPRPPTEEWQVVTPILSGICGSDLAMLAGRSSRWLEPLVTFPFVPGHEVVGRLADGRRVVLEAALTCRPRGIDPPCSACAAGHPDRCESLAFGALPPGLQTGFCGPVGGGWSGAFVAHPSQLHVVPEALSDEDAVVVEPTACAVHAVGRAGVADGEIVAIVGAGTMGLLVTAAVRHLARPQLVLAAAKHPRQRTLARELGADRVVDPADLWRTVRRATGSLAVAGRTTGGADCVFDCVGSAASLEQCLALVRPGGRIVLVGMPEPTRVDLTPLWQRQVSLVGAYAYGRDPTPAGERPSFAVAIELAGAAHLGRLVSARYPLERWPEAIAHALEAGRRGSVKVVFEAPTSWRSQRRDR